MIRCLLILIVIVSVPLAAADEKGDVLDYLDRLGDENAVLAEKIWGYAELGYLETQSSALLQSRLAEAGFEVTAGVAGLPTAFVASFGEGEPVIGILAEFDALPGISQSASPIREILEGQPNGHACGHHLFGTGSMAAALAIKNWMEATKVKGTIRLYGTPAEEGGSGKVYMVRAGLFADVDTVLHWHPSNRNAANPATSLANKSARFRFRGVSSHAAAAPDRGRSALDAVEAMNYMINMMREHVPQETRIHYVITKGGEAPNVVPDLAEVYYYVRHPDAGELLRIWDRVMTVSEAAAMGTGTQVEAETMHGNHSLLPNESLALVMHKNLIRIGGYSYSEEEQAFAQTISRSFGLDESYLGMESKVLPFEMVQGKGSTDVGDVSWVVPTTGLRTATWVPGTTAHSWQAIAAGGTSIGIKGMQVAAKTLALTAMDLFRNVELINKAKKELLERRGKDFQYKALLGDREPPLDYRLP
ncbi:MAG: amidohydrolase [Gammaproteobacteria bacterium]|jgi:aminobenzoyl-glutamate utilization protein B|nr:amidohydrolase [Gammaproteobacteria bacterium]|tara:strand:- start:2303 stop:3727 length:1425 start_codon:yes stop_codon:yes gene_type:complete